MKNIKLQAPRKLQDCYVGPLTILERIGKMAYQLNLAASECQALRGLHNAFHVGLLRRYQSNGLEYEAPPLEIDSKEHYKVQAIWKRHIICGQMQYLVKWLGYDESEYLWLTARQLDLVKEILEDYQRQNQMNSGTSIT